MSVVVGLVCEDSIVLASDRQYGTGVTAQYGEKIYPLRPQSWMRAVVGGVGSVGFVRIAAQKIEQALPLKQTSLAGVRTIVESTNKAFYESYVLPHGQPVDRVDYGLIVGICHKADGLLLLHTSANATEEVTKWELEGTGGVVAEPYRNLWRPDILSFEAELAAIFAVKYAKVYDAERCGGTTRVFSLFGDTSLERLNDDYIKLAEDYFSKFSELSLDILLPLDVSADLDTDFFAGKIQTTTERLAEDRANLRRWRPHAYESVP